MTYHQKMDPNQIRLGYRPELESLLFPPGFDDQKVKYHNMGMMMSPYPGKPYNSAGDYAPPQSTVYYTPDNRNYPYPLDPISAPCKNAYQETLFPPYRPRFLQGKQFQPLDAVHIRSCNNSGTFRVWPGGPPFHYDPNY